MNLFFNIKNTNSAFWLLRFFQFLNFLILFWFGFLVYSFYALKLDNFFLSQGEDTFLFLSSIVILCSSLLCLKIIENIIYPILTIVLSVIAFIYPLYFWGWISVVLVLYFSISTLVVLDKNFFIKTDPKLTRAFLYWLQIQTAFIYLYPIALRLQDKTWVDGFAFLQLLKNPIFSYYPDLIVSYEFFGGQILTWLALFIEFLCVIFIFLPKKIQIGVSALAITLHLSLLSVSALEIWQPVMVALHMLFLFTQKQKDDDYSDVFSLIKKINARQKIFLFLASFVVGLQLFDVFHLIVFQKTTTYGQWTERTRYNIQSLPIFITSPPLQRSCTYKMTIFNNDLVGASVENLVGYGCLPKKINFSRKQPEVTIYREITTLKNHKLNKLSDFAQKTLMQKFWSMCLASKQKQDLVLAQVELLCPDATNCHESIWYRVFSCFDMSNHDSIYSKSDVESKLRESFYEVY